MNNLKFRAWDNTAKKMSKVTAIDFSTKPFRVFYKAYGNENYFNQDAILMQSTGLHDKNGVEIFEGDIVQYLDGEYSFVGVVENSAFGIYAKNKYDNYSFEDFADENTKEADVVVIGNIYENKELLENDR